MCGGVYGWIVGWMSDWMHGWVNVCVGCLLVVAWAYGRLIHARGPTAIMIMSVYIHSFVRLERLLLRLRRGGFLPADSPSFEELARDADLGLFRSISSNPCHVLRHYFHEREHTGHNLRPRAHNFALPIQDDRNFISRVLYGVLN